MGSSEVQHCVMLCVAEQDPTLGLKLSISHYRVVFGLIHCSLSININFRFLLPFLSFGFNLNCQKQWFGIINTAMWPRNTRWSTAFLHRCLRQFSPCVGDISWQVFWPRPQRRWLQCTFWFFLSAWIQFLRGKKFNYHPLYFLLPVFVQNHPEMTNTRAALKVFQPVERSGCLCSAASPLLCSYQSVKAALQYLDPEAEVYCPLRKARCPLVHLLA